MKTVLRFSALFALLVLLASCAGRGIKIDESANGSEVTLRQGDTLTLKIEGNPTTGYTWAISEVDETILSIAGEAEYKSGSLLIGAGGVYTFTFKAAAPGTTPLKLIYYRSFEEGVPPVETFEVNVNVEP